MGDERLTAPLPLTLAPNRPMPARPLRLPLALVLAATASLPACRTAAPPVAGPIVATPVASPLPPHDNLNALQWMQTAEEYRAVTLSVYRLSLIHI